MPPLRTPLGLINTNQVGHKKDITSYLHSQVANAHNLGIKEAEIVRITGLSRGGVRSTIARLDITPNGGSVPRPGTPKQYLVSDY